MPVEFIPFQDHHLPAAANLLAARHRQDRLRLPALPARFEAPAAALKAVESAWRKPGANGIAAYRQGQLTGYLLGSPVIDTLRGRTAWVFPAGHALEPMVDLDLYRDLYAAAAPAWLAAGCFDHYVMAPAAAPALLMIWMSLGFGHEQAYALRPLTEVDRFPTVLPEGVTIRRATKLDQEMLQAVAPLIGQHQAQAPAWAPITPEFMAEIRAGYGEMAGDEEAVVWLAVQGEQLLGFQAYFPVEPAVDDLLAPEGCIELKVAATAPAARGMGIGKALTEYGLADARAQGYTLCLTDWRVTNLLSSRFWPRRGFQPVAYRLARHVDERVLWATGQAEVSNVDFIGEAN